MFKDIWVFVGILIIAIVLVFVILSFARADMIIDDAVNWIEIKKVYNDKTVIIILLNPNEGETVYNLITIKQGIILSYILVGDNVRFFVNKLGNFIEVFNEEQKVKVLKFLMMNIGLFNI